MKISTDVVIVGTGLAGLSLAKYLSEINPKTSILLLSKTTLDECNTYYAQGGIAVVHDFIKDSYEQHIADTIAAGKGLCDEEVVKHVITSAPARLQELLSWGVELDKNDSGALDLGLEGGHSQNRIVHHKDQTGWELETKLIQVVQNLPNVSIQTSFFATDLVVEHEKCVGIIGYNSENESVFINAKATVLATGGSGQVFSTTSNSSVATGDGIAMALRAKVKIENMQYVQFHPTAVYEPENEQAFLITEAIRGFGAHILNRKRERFLQKVHPDTELATRDIVSKAICDEMHKENSDNVWLDLSHLNPKELRLKFPKITNYCKQKNWDFTIDLIPIRPAAHYQCGGITVDQFGATSMNNLFAIGECSHTGLHGSNRLASNSLLEAVVYSHDLAGRLSILLKSAVFRFSIEPEITYQEIGRNDVGFFRSELKNIMNYDSVYGSDEVIFESTKAVLLLAKQFENKFPNYSENPHLCETYNLIQTAVLILSQKAIDVTLISNTSSSINQPYIIL
ncbi:L-aspartate oxidase [Flavobacterium antarcticum]|uniref:L-aspartate oxidase n=1 Tax=Flavobacterium antarcticum TaxID=271155 RepID=UPI0003B7032E|nr:FAD-binding protein [Flavobacterium antarcticum]